MMSTYGKITYTYRAYGRTIDYEREREREREIYLPSQSIITYNIHNIIYMTGCQRSISLSLLAAYDNQ